MVSGGGRRIGQRRGALADVAGITYVRVMMARDAAGSQLVLRLCFGDNATRFKVCFLRNWTFKFSVASRDVSFRIYIGDNIANDSFKPKVLSAPELMNSKIEKNENKSTNSDFFWQTLINVLSACKILT